MHGQKLGKQAERIRQAGASGDHKQNVERDCMRALKGVLDLVSWLIYKYSSVCSMCCVFFTNFVINVYTYLKHALF